MRIRSFRVKGYRSLRDVKLEPLGDVNTFYGPNGSGKSNVLDALQTFFCIMPIAVDTAYGEESERLSFREGGRLAAEYIHEEDFFARDDANTIEMAAVIEDPDTRFNDVKFMGQPVSRVEVTILFWRVRPKQYGLQFKNLYIDKRKPGLPFTDPTIRDLLQIFLPTAFTHIGVTRTLAIRVSDSGENANVRARHSIGTIPDGQLVRTLFEAKNASDDEVRKRFESVREFISEVLKREPFNVFINKEKELELREKLTAPNPLDRDIRVERAGHGIVQLYAIVASILLAGGGLVAIEEPEAHLHAPTLGRQVRHLLLEMVKTHRIHQLFIATHSNLFDLNPEGYWDVSLNNNGETIVISKSLDEIDRQHLVEPGPAKHQIQEMLRLYGDDVVFRAKDGREINASAMLIALQNDDDIAMAFLEALHGAALQVTGLRAKRNRAAAGDTSS